MKKSPLFLLLVIGFCLPFIGSTQTNQVAIFTQNVHKLSSKVLGEERTILVRVPENYAQSTERLPVLYVLDWNQPVNVTMVGIVEQEVWGGVMPNLILVGIQNTDRQRDMSPTKVEGAISGGADNFLEFIQKEVMPMIERNYRTQPYRILAGHSFAGLLTSYAFVSRPEMFNAYIAASPYLQWDKSAFYKKAEEAFRKKRDWKKTFYITLGDEPEYRESFNAFTNLLQKQKEKDFRLEVKLLPNDNHGSVVLPTYYGGLRKVFEGWAYAANISSLTELEAHYKNLSERFGYQIEIPENAVNGLGYQLLRGNRIAEAILVFKRNVEMYPNSANVYDSLGESYERNGQRNEALNNYEKAYKMAELQGNDQIAKAAKDNFERLSKLAK